MILLGSSDIGVLQYLSRLKTINNVEKKWITKKRYYSFLASNKLSVTKNYKNLKNIKLIITGTALGNSLDKKMVLFGKRKKIFTIQIIEHWTNFKERFQYKNKKLYADIIFVNDKLAYNLARKFDIPKNKLKIMGNVEYEYYINNKKLKKIKKKNSKSILFISEKISGSTIKITNEYKLDEFETIRKIVKELPKKYELIIKIHPEENLKNYKILSKYKNVKIIKNMKFADMIKKPKKIIGIKSALLLKLSIFRNDIISFRPKKDRPFIGDKLGTTKLVRKNLRENIEKKINNVHRFDKKFKGSSKKIKLYIQKILKK